MARLLILIAIVVVVAWWLMGRSSRQPLGRGTHAPPRTGQGAQEMVSCAHCGVHLPRTDAVVDGERTYCGEDHRLAGPRPS